MRFSSIVAVFAAHIACATAYRASDRPNYRNHWNHPPQASNPYLNVSLANATFEQFVSHDDHSLGTFQQFYYYSTEHWKGPGSPVILFTPGEANVTGYNSYLTQNRTTGVLAKQIGAAVVVLEHRYWGTSTPVDEYTTETLQYLTLDESISDLTHFARTAHLPWNQKPGQSNAPTVPWILMGGSYSGALTAWTASVSPGTFWAYVASSAVVEITGDFWQYFLPVQEGMPKNCSADVELVIDHIDEIGTSGTEEEQWELKNLFGLGEVQHFDDFAAALTNAPWLWQGNQFYRTTGFFDWCDAVENVSRNSTKIPGAEGVGLEKALAGYAKYFNETILPGFCEGFDYFEGERNVECFNTYDPENPMYTDTSLGNTVLRQWVWMTCNEPFGYWQSGAPPSRPTIVSRFSNYDWWVRQCPLYFPEVNGFKVGVVDGRTYDAINEKTDGWFATDIPRLFYVNGGFDPWREATVSAELRPGGPYQGDEASRVEIIEGGYHVSDFVTQNRVNADAARVIDEVLKTVGEWVAEFPGENAEW